ncbi:hypothetical protein JMJ77_0000792 [Colletotrichum scovillei]|uniref:Uncharacterized protein n=1 Tax=Colletotrichum scovillei TaxID=1209932 RepID=A0A9P7UHN8_9PEZI|nr:hypothetical protein JMJ77_0000792 [Colletotrichum scovillei]KAG7072000.1 hypothetical protein JMJ76_0004865 [Colletotrichum scovillei]KAG7080248.1 hypothetical protein JMJ78_0007347 [Colletotrichum scovillei]
MNMTDAPSLGCLPFAGPQGGSKVARSSIAQKSRTAHESTSWFSQTLVNRGPRKPTRTPTLRRAARAVV